MRILVVYRHFWPDSPPYASMLRSILGRLADDGHDVTMLAEQPCYKPADRAIDRPAEERLDGIRVLRLPRRTGAVGKAGFPIRAWWWARAAARRGERFDLVWTATIPPVIQGVAGRQIADVFGARFLYHLQDVYPELGAHSGAWAAGGVVDTLLRRLERRTRQRADALVTLSPDMAVTVTALARPRGRTVVRNNFLLDDFEDKAAPPVAATAPTTDGSLHLIFAGNLGAFQGLEALVDAMALLAADAVPVRLTLMGDGAVREALIARANGLPNVAFEPHRPFAQAQGFIAAADLGVVSLQPGIYRYAYPSKTLTYLGLGVPPLVIVEPDSALARTIVEEGIGVVVDGVSAQSIAAGIETIARHRDTLPAMRERAIAYDRAHASRAAALDDWSRLIADLAADAS